MAGTFILPREISEDPYFTGEKHVFSRIEALAWIAANVRWADNCVLKKWQETWSMRTLAKEWGWTLKRVRCFLEKLENKGFIRVSLGHIRGTAQIVITYLVQTLKGVEDQVGAQDRAQEGHSKGTSKKEHRNKVKKEEYSPGSAKADPFFPDEPEGATTEPPSSGFEEAVSPEAEPQSSPPPKAPRRSARSAGYTEAFEAAWRAMPAMARKRGSKPEAMKLWAKLSDQERADAVAGIALWPDNEYAMAAERWLKRQGWIGLLEVGRERAEKPKQKNYADEAAW